MGREIKLTVNMKTMDMFHFFMKHFYSTFSGVFGLVLSIGAFGVFLFSIGKREPFQMLLLIVLAALFTILQPLQFLLKAYQQVKMLPVYKEPLNYVWNEEGIRVVQGEENVVIPWKDIRKATESSKGIYVYTSSVHAFIFPKEQMKENVSEAKALLKDKLEKDICKIK